MADRVEVGAAESADAKADSAPASARVRSRLARIGRGSSANPVLDQKQGMLRLQGFFPLRPQPIAFEVLYQAVDGRWRLFGLSVQPVAPQPQAATRMPSPPPDPN